MTGIKKHNLISVLMALVAFTGMAGLVTPAFALTCERKTNNASGFVSYSAWESWFPKTLSIPDSQFKPKGGGSTSMVATRDTQDSKGYSKRMTYQLLANGDLIAKQSQTQGNFKSTSPIRYKCSTTAVALRTGKTNSDSAICYHATINGQWAESKSLRKYVDEAKRRGLDCGVSSKKSDSKTKIASSSEDFSDLTDTKVCFFVRGLGRGLSENAQKAIENEAKRRGLNCGVGDSSSKPTQTASTTPAKAPTNPADKDRLAKLEAELAALKAERADIQSKIDSDNQIPLIDIVEADASGKRGVIKGRVSDKSGVAELIIGGQVVALNSSGGFDWQGFVPAGGKSITIEATDKAGNTAIQQVRLERGQMQKPKGPRFERLNPLRGKKAVKNKDALALVIGVSDYERTSDPALYADKDAEYFHDYAAEKLGIPESQILTLINNKADRVEILTGVKDWLLRMSKKERSDIYVFFAGHGLASSDGMNMFLLPYDGNPKILEDSAIDRKQLFADIEAISPRSVTVFLDSCYSGSTRSGGTLVASLRPVFVRSQEQSIPSGFTVLSAAKSDQTSQSLEEAQHGLFSYFLMRGLEGEADTNKDNQITAGELHSFVADKVERQSSFQQTPELQGDESRVLVRFE